MNILLIDDSGVVRKLVSRSLRQGSLDIAATHEAASGQEGLELLGSESVDVVLCDWNMPVMDGPAFVAAARAAHDVPIIMLSAESSVDRLAEARGLGASGHVTQPFTPEKLVDGITAALHRNAA